MGQGRENAKAFLADNLELVIELSEKVRQKVGVGAPSTGGAGAGEPSTELPDDRPILLEG